MASTLSSASSSAASSLLLSKTVALVTGGSSGLGAATTKFLLQHSARVVVADVNRPTFDATVEQSWSPSIPNLQVVGSTTTASSSSKAQVHSHGPVVTFCETDVTDTTQVSNALDHAETHFGEPISACISCAGIAVAAKTFSKKHGPHSLEDFERVLRINTIGTFNVARLSAERMSQRQPEDDSHLRGCLINTASIAAYEGQIGQVAYSASKGAVVGMTLPMARDLAPLGLRVVTIAPGLFATPLLTSLPQNVQDQLSQLIPCPNRLGHPDEFGQLVGAILTIPTLNGCVLRLDGALRMPP